MKIRNYFNIFLIFIWMLTIFNFSNQKGTESSGLSDKVIVKIAEILKRNTLSSTEKEHIIDKYRFIVRKTAHFTSYFILGTLIIILFLDLKLNIKKSNLITLIICFIYACTDEIHQLFISGRNGSFIDVLIDTSGVLTALIIIYLLLLFKKKCIKQK